MGHDQSEREGLQELLPPLSAHEATLEAARCLMCYDAPCTHACPTHIDVPKFIKKIYSNNLKGSARTILEANLLGATCSRVCPVQQLCEGACVLNADQKPIEIGRLQRYAMDYAYGKNMQMFQPAAATGQKIAVIGAGPAGLSCAGELAKRGHSVTLFERRDLGGGLSTYGIIVLREPVDVALAEVRMIEQLGVKVETGRELGVNLSAEDLRSKFDAVFLSVGLGRSPSLGIPGEEHILDGLEYIEWSKLDTVRVPLAHEVAVIGAGNTAIDCATIAKRLGADRVTMVYRRSENEMTAYPHEYDFIKKEGVGFYFLAQPVRVIVEGKAVRALECVRMSLGSKDATGRPAPMAIPGSEFQIPARQIIKAIGQEKPVVAEKLGLRTNHGFIAVDPHFETSVPGIYAGGDCIRARGAASTVMAVEDGKLAAQAIHHKLTGNSGHERQNHG